MNILLISGHGAGDPGATSSIGGVSYRESDETRRVTSALSKALSDYCDVTVYPTDRNAYEDYKKGTLASVAQFSRYDYVLEIHFNALKAVAADGKTKGVECYVPVGAENDTTEEAICNAVAAVGLTNRGVKRYNWAVISKARQSGTSAALLEVCFIDDPDDMAVYKAKFQAIVDAIASAIIATHDLKKEEAPVTYETFREYMDQYMTELAVKEPSDWSKDARAWAEGNGLIQGSGHGRKKYKSPVTREELVQILYRMKG